MKPRFKIGDILKYEDNDTIDIFKVSQIQIDKETNEVKYISIFQETFIDDGNGSLELYKEQDKITDAVVLNSPCDPMLDIPTMTTNCPPNLLPNELPKTWEDVNMLVLTNKLNVDLKERYAEICEIAHNTSSALISNETWKKHINFMKLLLLRDIYNYLNDFPKINNNHIISIKYNHMTKKIEKFEYVNKFPEIFNTRPVVLDFDSRDYRDLFFDNFKDLIEKCKEFI